MQMGHDVFVAGEYVEQLGGQVGRFEGTESDSLDTVDRSQLFE